MDGLTKLRVDRICDIDNTHIVVATGTANDQIVDGCTITEAGGRRGGDRRGEDETELEPLREVTAGTSGGNADGDILTVVGGACPAFLLVVPAGVIFCAPTSTGMVEKDPFLFKVEIFHPHEGTLGHILADKELDGVDFNLLDVDDGRVDHTAVAVDTRDHRLGGTGDERIGLRVGRNDVRLGRDATLEIVASVVVVACRHIPLVDAHIKAVGHSGFDNEVAVEAIMKLIVGGMESIARHGHGAKEVGCAFIEVDRIETDRNALARVEVTIPIDGA